MYRDKHKVTTQYFLPEMDLSSSSCSFLLFKWKHRLKYLSQSHLILLTIEFTLEPELSSYNSFHLPQTAFLVIYG